MGSAALLAFMASLTNRQFTATQFALLSTLATLPRSLLSAPSGFIAEGLGWPQFYVACTLLAIPGLLLLPLVRQWFGEEASKRSAPTGRSALQSSQS
jgi:PAT family beta-lactamase induction signal transducer AmpG